MVIFRLNLEIFAYAYFCDFHVASNTKTCRSYLALPILIYLITFGKYMWLSKVVQQSDIMILKGISHLTVTKDVSIRKGIL